MSGVFISYRRDDSQGFAGRLENDLSQRFGDALVFRDREIPPGADFGQHIEEQLTKADAVLVVIGRRWLDAVDAAGHRRLEQPGDWVRREIERALECNLPLIPLLVGGVDMPSPHQLPPSLQALTRYQAHALSDLLWHEELDLLCQALVARVPALANNPRPGSQVTPEALAGLPKMVRTWRWTGLWRWLGGGVRRVSGLALLAGIGYILVRALGGVAANRALDRVLATAMQEIQRLF